MATTKRFSTGGGFPFEGSPRRTIEFTLSYGKSNRFDPNSTGPSYGYNIAFANPEDSAYVCAMYGPPRDEEGLRAFADALSEGYDIEAKDPVNKTLPVPPLDFGSRGERAEHARNEISEGRIAQGCLWGQQLKPGTRLSIDVANGTDADAYRVRAVDGDGRTVDERTGSINGRRADTYFDSIRLLSERESPLGYDSQARANGFAFPNENASQTTKPDDAQGARFLSRRVISRGTEGNIHATRVSASGDFDVLSPTSFAPLQQADGALEASGSKPIRYLSRRVVGQPTTAAFDGATDPYDAFDMPVSSLVSDRITPLDSNQPALAPQTGKSLGLLTGKPMSEWIIPPSIFDFSGQFGASGRHVADWPASLVGLSKSGSKSPASVFDAGVPAAPSAPPTEFRFPDYRNSLADAGDASSPDTPAGLAGRVAALVGVDPANPDPRVLTPPDNGFYNDGMQQPWLFGMLTGRLR